MTEPSKPDWSAVTLGIRDRARAARPEGQTSQQVIEAQRADRVRRANIAHALAQIPARYQRATVSHDMVGRWVDAVQARRTRDSLVLMGQVGTGKTHEAYAAFSLLGAAGYGRCEAVTVPAFLDGLRPGRPGGVDNTAVETADLLLLDDLAAERVTDWTGEVLYRLIDARWAHMRPTIITTNATGATVRERLGDRVASRLNGMGVIVSMTGEDRRVAGKHRPGT
jgi:DNA replication protein DnaC